VLTFRFFKESIQEELQFHFERSRPNVHSSANSIAHSDLRFHDLRQTAATQMVIGGIDLVTVKEILGHATIQMTMRYAHPTPENKRHAVEVLSKLFELTQETDGAQPKESAQPFQERGS
jgi:integrase